MALADERRRHAREQRRRILRRNHHGSCLRTDRLPIATAVGAAGSVLFAGNTVIAGRWDGSRSRHPRRSRCPSRNRRRLPRIRARAKGIAHDISQQRRPRILPRGKRKANPHALGRTNRALAARSGANLHVHPRARREKRLLTRGKRNRVFQQHAQGALRQQLGKQGQGLSRLHQP